MRFRVCCGDRSAAILAVALTIALRVWDFPNALLATNCCGQDGRAPNRQLVDALSLFGLCFFPLTPPAFCYRERMNLNVLLDGMLGYLYLLILLTFHEFAHAWVAWKRGDDTARLQGRVSLNPLVHLDMMGTVVLPIIFIVLGATVAGSTLFFGWAKPVPVNIANLRRPRIDDTLIALAGPAMNLLLAVAIMGLVKAGQLANSEMLVKIAVEMTQISLILCFFNLLPIPPLDGSHVVKNLIGMSYETYWRFCQYGFIAVLIVIQFRPVRWLLAAATDVTFVSIARLYRVS